MSAPDPIQEARERLYDCLNQACGHSSHTLCARRFERAVILSHDEKVEALKDAARGVMEARSSRMSGALALLGAALAALEEQAP